jgi:hypothetical protein
MRNRGLIAVGVLGVVLSGAVAAAQDLSRYREFELGSSVAANRASLVNAAWIVLGMGIAVAVLMLATSWFRRDHDVDLGSLSHHWITEQRMGQGHDPQR